MRSPGLVAVLPCAAGAFGLPVGLVCQPGAWFATESGEVRALPDGQLEPRPRPEAPQMRSSVAANPCVRRGHP